MNNSVHFGTYLPDSSTDITQYFEVSLVKICCYASWKTWFSAMIAQMIITGLALWSWENECFAYQTIVKYEEVITY
jgi:hypothetical protein